MRAAALVVGGLLLIGGVAMVTVADQERVRARDDARSAVAEAQQLLDAKHETNARLAETLTSLRSRIAEQDTRLSDPTGLLP
ncbi:hypothetical protein [Microbacterium sp. XT11]|uniref:hypothetical protein n=1 Tax=Microbacterium sp. XT11 TaxID=367477 RepID=UPI00082F4ECA|nr:hypothetical protein [Microbacterium sp. XT11]